MLDAQNKTIGSSFAFYPMGERQDKICAYPIANLEEEHALLVVVLRDNPKDRYFFRIERVDNYLLLGEENHQDPQASLGRHRQKSCSRQKLGIE
jgi:hypothetical protein